MSKIAKNLNPTHPELKDTDMGAEGTFSTDELPMSGHDSACDDGQQKTAARTLFAVAEEVSKKDKPLARRIRVLGKQVLASVGIQEGKQGDFYSTASLELSDDEGAVDSDQKSGAQGDSGGHGGKGVLPVYGVTTPAKGATGPQKRSSSKKTAGGDCEKCRNWSYDLNKDGICPDCGGKEDPLCDDEADEAEEKKACTATAEEEKKEEPKTETKEASVDPWKTFKRSLNKKASRQGKWGQGYWETKPEFFGRAADLHVNTALDDGSPLIASTVTFSLVGEDKEKRIATVEVADNAYLHESTKVKINSKTASKLADLWVKRTEEVAKSQLED